MAGSNAFAFNGTAFVPEDRNLTAGISVRTSPTTTVGVARAYGLTNGSSATQFWIGYPPTPATPTFRNVRTGTFPNLANSIWVDWTCDTSTLIASFDIFAKIGTGSYSLVANVSASTRTYNYGNISADTAYSFYIRARGVSALNTTSGESSTSLAGAGLVSALGTAKTNTTATVSWTVTAGEYQKFFIYDGASYLATVNATEGGTSFSYARTSLSQGTAYNFRVYGQNINGFTSSYREANITTNTMPVPTISWESTSATLYSGFRVYWSGSTDVSYQPQYSSDNSNWSNLGAVQSGTGTKYCDAFSPGYADDYYVRVYVYNSEVSAYTNTKSVTPGRVEISSTTAAGWGGESSSSYTATINSRSGTYANGSTNGQASILWGDESAIQVNSDANTDRKVTSVTVRASKISGYSGSLTSDTRRVAINLAGSAARSTYFDGGSATLTQNMSHTYGYSDGVARTLYYGVRDNQSYWNSSTATWRYSSTTGSSNFWPSDRTAFLITVSYTQRSWVPAYTTVTQSQVNTTYG
jgi:hypothetical protein